MTGRTDKPRAASAVALAINELAKLEPDDAFHLATAMLLSTLDRMPPEQFDDALDALAALFVDAHTRSIDA
jgi:hypothetical protein